MVVELGPEKEIFARGARRIEVHLSEEDTKYLDELAAKRNLSTEEVKARIIESAIANRLVDGLLTYRER